MSSVKKDSSSTVNHGIHSDVRSSSVTGVVGSIGRRKGNKRGQLAPVNRAISEIDNIKMSLRRTSNIGEIAQKNSLSLTFVEGDTIYRTEYKSNEPVKIAVGSVRKRVSIKNRVIKLK